MAEATKPTSRKKRRAALSGKGTALRKATPRRPLRSANPVIMLISLLVMVAVAGSLWLAGQAIREKIRLAHGVHQIVDIVNMSRDAAHTNRDLGHRTEDMIADLEHLERMTASDTVDNMRIVRNPWMGQITAIATPDQTVRLETIVPPGTCHRIVELFSDDSTNFGLTRIEIRDGHQGWQTAYTPEQQLALGSENLYTGTCYHSQQTTMALIFPLR